MATLVVLSRETNPVDWRRVRARFVIFPGLRPKRRSEKRALSLSLTSVLSGSPEGSTVSTNT